jgi:predicted AAA+ superfamily ATPase
MWINRHLSSKIKEIAAQRPVLLLTGARQVGKTSLLRHIFPDKEYLSLDRPLTAQELIENPEAILGHSGNGFILDEVQYAPVLFRHLKLLVDQDRQSYGRFILTGSQIFQMMKGVSESLAGRIAIMHLFTLSATELNLSNNVDRERFMWAGGYPEIWEQRALDVPQFFNDYISTYLQRDLRVIVEVRDLRAFDRFLRLIAIRAGQLVNFTEISRDTGASATTIKTWAEALVISGVIELLPPYYKNLGSRLIKSPKLYFHDHGLLCHLLGIHNSGDLAKSPHRGAVWENLVFSELRKSLGLGIPQPQLFFFRDKYGLEADFILTTSQQTTIIECKASENPSLDIASLKKVRDLISSDHSDISFKIAALVPHEVQLNEVTLWNPLSRSKQ